jgi:CBS domain-containing protein
MSARAAWRLEQLGFTRVYDYHAGRQDWEAAGLLIEGTEKRGPMVKEAVTYDPPMCGPDDSVGTARSLLGGSTQVVVVNKTGVILGVMRKESWNAPDEASAGDVMRLGPSTVRPGSLLAPLIERMQEKDTESVLVSDAEGRLIGVLERADGKAFLSGERVESSFETCESCPGWWRHRLAS